jgi:hypothetical protein
MTRLALFAYASLVSTASAAETIGRPVEIAVPARLPGWSRGWTLGRDNIASEKTFARPNGTLPRFCLGLNLDPAGEAPAPNGALIELSDAELARLDLREMRYRRVEVTDSIRIGAGDADTFDAVFAYTAHPEHHRPTPPEDTIVIANYLRAVETAFAALGSQQLKLFRATTQGAPVEVTEATLIHDRILEGNPRGW